MKKFILCVAALVILAVSVVGVFAHPLDRPDDILTGVVINAVNHSPIPDAQVKVKVNGNTIQTTTRQDGAFTLYPVHIGDKLEISCPGYVTDSICVSGYIEIV